jgi:hypothetical protein
VQFITGMAEDPVRVDWYASTLSSGGGGVSPAFDNRTSPAGLLYIGVPGPTSQCQMAAAAYFILNPVLGYHFLEILEGTPTGASALFDAVSFTSSVLS